MSTVTTREGFLVFLLVPWTAINLTDFYLIRRGRYDIPELFKVNGIYGKVNWYAIVVYALAVGVQFPFMNDTAVYVGPVSQSLGGSDISWLVGFVFAAVVYYLGARYWTWARSGQKSAAVTPGAPGGVLGA